MILVDKETGQEYEVSRPTAMTDSGHVVIKPITKNKPVDMSVLIGSGIDCLFWDDENYTATCTLREIKSTDYGDHYRSQLHLYPRCTPRMNYWFSSLNYDDSHLIDKLEKAGFKIFHNGGFIAFKITGLQEGYCWPWECEA